MPKQNRITPFGKIIAVEARGTLMGNRGQLHDVAGQILRPWQVKRWIACSLEFNGRRRQVMAEGQYTELFFLDEATALAAGHRPCAECRRDRFRAFCQAWAECQGIASTGTKVMATQVDEVLHTERVNPDKSKRTFPSETGKLPGGVIVTIEPEPETAYLVLGDDLLPWSPAGYGQRIRHPKGIAINVLTPFSMVAAIRAGYTPERHATANT